MSFSLAKVREQAIRLLARREHSLFELKQKLISKGVDNDSAESVLQELSKQGLQSDERFTESFINSRSRRGYGPTRIRLELQERKIDDNLINLFLHPHAKVWIESAKAVFRKKSGGEYPKDDLQRVKITNFLKYRGFTHEQIKAALSGEEQE